MTSAAPIRFLIMLLVCWAGIRIAVLAPGWQPDEPGSGQTLPAPPPHEVVRASPVRRPTSVGAIIAPAARLDTLRQALQRAPASAPASARRPSWRNALPGPEAGLRDSRAAASTRAAGAPLPISTPIPQIAPAANELPTAASSPFSGSGWLLLRSEGATTLAPAGSLGGSQAGVRLLYRLNADLSRPLALSGRLHLPIRRPVGAEAAFGIDWRPVAGLPVRLLAERRHRLGREGRSAFSITAYGGGAMALGAGWRLDGYAQAGLVGIRSRDAFVDGSARFTRSLGPVELGGALWGAAQPGTARLDAGPVLSLPIAQRRSALRVSGEYRFRLTGDSRPDSGPALTLGVDF